MKNFETIKSELETAGITPKLLSDYANNIEWRKKYPTTSWKESETDIKIRELVGEIEMAEHYGGEGEGETWYDVILFKEHDVYVQIDAYYQSYDGTDFSSSKFREVKPETITKVVYK